MRRVLVEKSRMTLPGIVISSSPMSTEVQARELQAQAISRHHPSLSKEELYEGAPPAHRRAVMEHSPLQTRVFYLSHVLRPEQIPHLITDVPQLAVSGDQAIELQSGTALMGPEGRHYTEVIAARNLPPLLTPIERRLSRKKVLASRCRVFACGGYPRGDPRPYSSPYPQVIIVTAAGPQFEMDSLEWKDFIIDVDAPADPSPLFPHCYPHSNGVIPSHSHVCALLRKAAQAGRGDVPALTEAERAEADCYINVGKWPLVVSPGDKPPKLAPGERPGPLILNARALFESLTEDCRLILIAFARMVEELNEDREGVSKKFGYFKFVAIGTGFFAQNQRFGSTSLAPIIYPLLLRALERVLNEDKVPKDKRGRPWIQVIELPDFSGRSTFTPTWGDQPIHGISINKGHHRDVLEFTREEFETYHCGALNAGDCFCIPGNERQYASVEAAIGNNSDLRIQQAYYHNPQVLDVARYAPVE